MAYSHEKTRDLLKVAAAYASSPMGEYVAQLSTQLFDAEAEIKSLTVSQGDIRLEFQESERRLVAESQAHAATKVKLSEEIRVIGEKQAILVAALSAIKADARGAKALATDALDKLTPKPEAAPAA